ncbi:hypothetical protein CHCC20375_3659 [Bacillus licheniformis]|nr:hypothetical protein CHCC20375_3659 [Bacillus licheniformis]
MQLAHLFPILPLITFDAFTISAVGAAFMDKAAISSLKHRGSCENEQPCIPFFVFKLDL